jgi:oxygen-dependent protoporphyrinogen oxidase
MSDVIMTKHLVIVGGGITGLAAAYRTEQLNQSLRITLIERDKRLGGKLLTEHIGGFVVEGAPDSFLSRKPRGVGLCEELGIAKDLQGRRPEFARTFVRHHGALHRLPTGLTGMIPTNLDALADSTLISQEGRERLAQEAELLPAPPAASGFDDESVASFVTRRLGREVYEKLVEPLMSGIYAGDGEMLSLAATFPQLRQLELKFGSLLKGLQAGQNGGPPQVQPERYPPFVTFANGMETLVDAIVERLQQTQLLTGATVETVTSNGAGYDVLLGDGRMLHADALIVTTPAFVTAHILGDLDPVLADLHRQIPYVSSALVSLGFAQTDLPRPLDGYGYVIPRIEETDLLACTWTSSKWSGRAPASHALVRVYAGRYGRRDIAQCSDDELLALAYAELRLTLGVTAQAHLVRIHRWPSAMPQYLLGHVERVAQIEAQLARREASGCGLYLAGAAYRGVGIPDCIESGEQAARQAVQYLT